MTAGEVTTTPTVTLTLEINDAPIARGDVNLDGTVTAKDAQLLVSWYYGETELSSDQIAAADANGDGKADILDANRILSTVNGVLPENSTDLE